MTVPGAVAGWDALTGKFGRKRLAQVLGPAIRIAEEGFPVSEWVAAYWKDAEELLRKTPGASATFLPAGRPPRVGEFFRNPHLADTLRQIASGGRKGFYEGRTGRRIVELSKSLGGTFELEDLAEFEVEWVEPISTTYRGWTVYEIPPSGQGIAALQMLNIVENFPMDQFGHNSADALHVMIEAKKVAYADLERYVADPRRSPVPVTGMLSKAYAGLRAGQIDMQRARCDVEPGGHHVADQDTTYLCVVDGEGNMVSLIQSIFHAFGSGLVPDGTGFALHNRGGLFTFDSEHPNALEGRKRPVHTIIPGFMQKEDRAIAFGIMGGWNQAQAHAQFVSNVADHGLNIQQALEAARFTKRTFGGCDVQIENRVPEAVREELSRRGHMIEVKGAFSTVVGGGQAVLRDFANSVNYGASDPRKDGAAAPELKR